MNKTVASGGLDYHAIFQALSGPYLILKPDSNFTILDATDAYLQATMTTREGIAGRGLFEIFPDNPAVLDADGVRNLRASLEYVIAHHQPHTMAVQRYDVRRPISQGGGFEEKYWSPINSPVLDDNGELLYIIHRVEDLTEFIRLKQRGEQLRDRAEKSEAEVHKRAQEIQAINGRLEHARQAAEAANRAKDRFLAMLSHELRTPLSPVLMSVDALQADQDLKPEVREELSMIRRNVEVEVRLIDDLLDLSRSITGKLKMNMQPASIHNVLLHALKISLPDIQSKHLRIVTDFQASNDAVTGDPARLKQVFWNLLSNAIKFTPANGQITIHSENAEQGIRVSITDTGMGIPRESLDRIFNAFEQADKAITQSFGGLGLGLAICRAIVDGHGGTITASSDGVGKGATFTVRLPILPGGAT